MYYLLDDLANEYEARLLREKMLLDLQQVIRNLEAGDSVSVYTITNSWDDKTLTPDALKFKEASQYVKGI